MFDVLTDVLEQVRLAGTLYFSAELRAPWGVSVRPEGRAPFYLVARGGCLLEVDGEPGALTLAAGDLALLPRAHPHVIRSDAKAPPVPFGRFVKEHPMDERGFSATAARARPRRSWAASSCPRSSKRRRCSRRCRPSSISERMIATSRAGSSRRCATSG